MSLKKFHVKGYIIDKLFILVFFRASLKDTIKKSKNGAVSGGVSVHKTLANKMRRKSESPNVILADRAELLPIPLINGNNAEINGTSNATAVNGLSLAPSEFNTCVENVTPPRYHSRVNLESQTGNGLANGSEMNKGQDGGAKQLNFILPKTQIVVTKYGDHMETMC